MNTDIQRRERFPIFSLLAAVVLSALLAITVVGGALATNRRVAAAYRAELERDMVLAQENSLDLHAIRRGQTEFLSTCITCHGPNGEAKPNLGKDLRISEFIAAKSNKQLVMFLKLGRGSWEPDNTTGVAMPPKGGNPMLNDQNLADLVQFIRYIQVKAKQ